MDSITSFMIQVLKAQIEVCHLQAIEYAKEYEASSTKEQKEEIATRWDWVRKKAESLKTEIELLEKMAVGSATVN